MTQIEVVKERYDYKASYNGVAAKGECAITAIANAKKKYELIELSQQLDIVNADLERTLEEIKK